MLTLCSGRGEIKLINSEGNNIIAIRKYFTRYHRKQILKDWERLYTPEKFSKMVIQIVPEIDETKDDKMLSKIKRIQAGKYGRRKTKQQTIKLCQELKLNTFTLVIYEQYAKKK